MNLTQKKSHTREEKSHKKDMERPPPSKEPKTKWKKTSILECFEIWKPCCYL